jgi:hypothetical protein
LIWIIVGPRSIASVEWNHFLHTREALVMSLLSLMIVLALIATVGALGAGLVSMMRGGEYDRQHSTQLMAARVGFQGAALVLMLVALFIANV